MVLRHFLDHYFLDSEKQWGGDHQRNTVISWTITSSEKQEEGKGLVEQDISILGLGFEFS